MENSNLEPSILDKVIDSQQTAYVMDFNPQQILKSLLNILNDRETEVLTLRHGFNDNKKRTLEEIGKKFNVTRERIRQIENSALKKIIKIDTIDDQIKPLEVILNQTLDCYGGIMHENQLIKKILIVPGENDSNYAATYFIITQLLKNRFHYITSNKNLNNSWKLPTSSLDEILTDINLLLDIIKKYDKPISTNEIYKLLTNEYENNKLNEQIIDSYLEISKDVNTNPFNEWGMIYWNSISLKRMSDKIFLTIKKHDKPLHFTMIAQKINEIGFDKKKANPATIHNELILDKKYVLVGRGIYALTEWGYKPGVVADVITEVLNETNNPLSREEIIERVLDKRLVKRSTIILALMDKNKFKKTPNGEFVINTPE